MSMNNQRGTTAPGKVSGDVPDTPPPVPTKVNQETKQGPTQPGDDPAMRVVITDPPSWKEKVVAYAKKFRGTTLRRPEVKEHGDKILQGRATIDDPNKVPERTEHPNEPALS